MERQGFRRWRSGFCFGHPGSTQRSDTYAALELDRDTVTPMIIQILKRRIALLKEYSARGPEQARQAASMIFGLENGRKVYEGRLLGLQDKGLMNKKRKEEDEFKAKVDANPEWKKEYGSAWERDAKAVEKDKSRIKEQFLPWLRFSTSYLGNKSGDLCYRAEKAGW